MRWWIDYAKPFCDRHGCEECRCEGSPRDHLIVLEEGQDVGYMSCCEGDNAQLEGDGDFLFLLGVGVRVMEFASRGD